MVRRIKTKFFCSAQTFSVALKAGGVLDVVLEAAYFVLGELCMHEMTAAMELLGGSVDEGLRPAFACSVCKTIGTVNTQLTEHTCQRAYAGIVNLHPVIDGLLPGFLPGGLRIPPEFFGVSYRPVAKLFIERRALLYLFSKRCAKI